MKSFDRLIAAVLCVMLIAAAAVNAVLLRADSSRGDNVRVETERAKADIKAGSEVNTEDYEHITGIYKYDGSEAFFEAADESIFFKSGEDIYRIDFKRDDDEPGKKRQLIYVNISLIIFMLITAGVLFYIRKNIIKPFNDLSEMPIELAKGNLSAPLNENKSRYFGRFVWGTDMLREAMEKQRVREQALQKDKQTLILSLSHDIKTPLSAIKLYSQALERGLYKDEKKLEEVYKGIGERADEIEGYLSKLSSAAREDFLELEVNMGEAYFSELIGSIRKLYSGKLSALGTEFEIGEFSDCLVKCDKDRSIEVMQNLMENAVKYGDGRAVRLSFRDEEDCRLVTFTSTGGGLDEDELLHIFESFYRGKNVGSKPGSGLGLYIARQLMIKMGGDIFADISDGSTNITLVFPRA